MHRIAICDTLHIHKRNFKSFFEFMEEKGIKPSILLDKDDDGYNLIPCTGNYNEIEQHVSPFVALAIRDHAKVIANKTIDELYDSEMLELKLWPLCRSELLSYLLSKDEWQQEVTLKDDRLLFEEIFKKNHEDLTLNIAVAKFWLNHWYRNRKKIFSNHGCCVFSGSATYTRTLLELLRRSQCRAFIMESTFTGNDYIFEEMYQPVANNLGVRHQNTKVARRNPELETPSMYDRELTKARNKVVSANNKNVKQPESEGLPQFINDEDQILIMGQVANDYSLIEDGFPYISSIPVYKELMKRILDETNLNIIFKAHPWEHKKVNIERSFTFDYLKNFIRDLPANLRSRVLLVEETNLQDLLDNSQYFLTLCSQSGIEAAMNGIRPIVLGTAFYSNAGFTLDCPSVDVAIEAIKNSNGTLSLEEYKAFNRFIVDMFQYGTISSFPSGKGKIEKILHQNRSIEQKTPIKPELALSRGENYQVTNAQKWTGVLEKLKPIEDRDTLKNLSNKLTISLVGLPEKIKKSDRNSFLSINLENLSGYIIPHSFEGRKGFLSYHIYDEKGKKYTWDGERQPLRAEVKRGLQGRVPFKAPSETGKYKVVPALLYSSICWIDSDQTWEFEVV